MAAGGERLQAEQGAVAVADQVGEEIAFEPLLEVGVVVGIDAEGGADEDLAASVIAAGLTAQARLGAADLFVDGGELLTLGGLEVGLEGGELVLGGALGSVAFFYAGSRFAFAGLASFGYSVAGKEKRNAKVLQEWTRLNREGAIQGFSSRNAIAAG